MSNNEIFGISPYRIKKFKSYMADNGTVPTEQLFRDIEELNKNKVDLN